MIGRKENAHGVLLAFGEAFAHLGVSLEEARKAVSHLDQEFRWHRFDTFYGPLIGGAVIVGILVLAALAAIGGW